MKKNERYYGEVWFPTNEQDRKFAVLIPKDDEIIIETNLYSYDNAYKEPQIFGSFNGLGYVMDNPEHTHPVSG
jgi:hypothetical protein